MVKPKVISNFEKFTKFKIERTEVIEINSIICKRMKVENIHKAKELLPSIESYNTLFIRLYTSKILKTIVKEDFIIRNIKGNYYLETKNDVYGIIIFQSSELPKFDSLKGKAMLFTYTPDITMCYYCGYLDLEKLNKDDFLNTNGFTSFSKLYH